MIKILIIGAIIAIILWVLNELADYLNAPGELVEKGGWRESMFRTKDY